MSTGADLIRVVNQQLLPRSILIDKIDRSSGNFETGIATQQQAKQKVYVPLHNPLDTSVNGYIDMVPTDEVLLSLNEKTGTLFKLALQGYITTTAFAPALTFAPVVTAAVHESSPDGVQITGTTFLSLAPDVTYVTLVNLSGATQKLTQAAITTGGGSVSATAIDIKAATITIGAVAAGWMVVVQANSKQSNTFTVG